jgi:hypothetical protein
MALGPIYMLQYEGKYSYNDDNNPCDHYINRHTTRKRSIGTSTLVPVKNEPALTCLNSVRRAR